jgi:hypothetical protein
MIMNEPGRSSQSFSALFVVLYAAHEMIAQSLPDGHGAATLPSRARKQAVCVTRKHK